MSRTILITACLAGALLLTGCPENGGNGGSSSSKGYVYTVTEADNSFEDVSIAVYGKPEHAEMIDRANPEITVDELEPGVKLTIPMADGLAPINCSYEELYY